MMKLNPCPYCEANDNHFIELNQSKEYSGIEMCLNRKGALRVRYYEDENDNFTTQDIIEIKYCPCCGKEFSFKGQNIKNVIWYRFKTNAVDDYRPLIDMKDIDMPWWCTGVAGDDSYATIVCYLPKGEDLFKYWDDAYDIDCEERTEIVYTDRFRKPEWLQN